MAKKSLKFQESSIPELAMQVRIWRRHKNLKQSELESRAGLSHNALSRIETGIVSPKLDTIEKLAESLDISIEELQFRKPRIVQEDQFESNIKAVMDRISNLPAKKQQKLLDSIIPLIDLFEEGD